MLPDKLDIQEIEKDHTQELQKVEEVLQRVHTGVSEYNKHAILINWNFLGKAATEIDKQLVEFEANNIAKYFLI